MKKKLLASLIVGLGLAFSGSLTYGAYIGTLGAGVVISSSTPNGYSVVAPGTAGNVLTSNGTIWTSSGTTGGGASSPWLTTSTFVYLATSTNTVGIGTSTPIYPLVVHLGTNENLNIQVPTAYATGVKLRSADDANSGFSSMEFAANGFDFYGGNVGLGTSNPTTTLDVNGDITDENTKSASVMGSDSTGKLIVTTTTALGSNAFSSVAFLPLTGGTLSGNVTGTTAYFTGTTTLPIAVDAAGNRYSTSTSGGTPGGSGGNIQYNNNGSLGATSTFTFATSTRTLSIPQPTSSILLTNSSGAIGGIGAPTNGTGTVLSYQNGAWTSGLYQVYATTTTTISTSSLINVATTTLPVATPNSVYDVMFYYSSTDNHGQTSAITFGGNTLFTVNDAQPFGTMYLKLVMDNSTGYGTYFANLYHGRVGNPETASTTAGTVTSSTLILNLTNQNVGANSNTITTTSSVTMMQ